jgi:zinc transport system permease protein
MTNFFSELFNNPFLLTALFAGFLASIASGITGSYVVLKKISSLSGSIAHSVLGGIGFFLWLKYNLHCSWADPLYGAFFAAIISALLIGYIHLYHKQKEDAIIATIWSSGMALGVIFVSITEGDRSDFSNILFGNILFVSQNHLYLLAFLDLLLACIVFLFYRKLLSICYDEELSFLQGIPVSLFYLLLLTLIAIAIVLLIQVVGIILAIALLTIPATISSLFFHRLLPIMVASTMLCFISHVVGSGLAYAMNWPSGSTIALMATFFYIIALLVKKFFKIVSH